MRVYGLRTDGQMLRDLPPPQSTSDQLEDLKFAGAQYQMWLRRGRTYFFLKQLIQDRFTHVPLASEGHLDGVRDLCFGISLGHVPDGARLQGGARTARLLRQDHNRHCRAGPMEQMDQIDASRVIKLEIDDGYVRPLAEHYLDGLLGILRFATEANSSFLREAYRQTAPYERVTLDEDGPCTVRLAHGTAFCGCQDTLHDGLISRRCVERVLRGNGHTDVGSRRCLL